MHPGQRKSQFLWTFYFLLGGEYLEGGRGLCSSFSLCFEGDD